MIETSAIGVPPVVEVTRPLIDASVPWPAIATGQSAIVTQRTPPSACSRHPPHRTQDAIEKITTSTSSQRSPAPRARRCGGVLDRFLHTLERALGLPASATHRHPQHRPPADRRVHG